jgi:hypothetical protein
MSSGEEKGWETLARLDPKDVCGRAQVDYDTDSGIYTLRSFSRNISIFPGERRIFSQNGGGDIILQKLGYFSRLSILWYLVGAKEIPLSGKLIKPGDLKGGQLFFRGTHILPLQGLAEKYCADVKSFYLKAQDLGSERIEYGDASIKLLPLPRVPVVLLLWKGDDEFPARADLLLDSTCEFHLPLDIIWSVAMMSVLIIM